MTDQNKQNSRCFTTYLGDERNDHTTHHRSEYTKNRVLVEKTLPDSHLIVKVEIKIRKT